MRATGYYWVKFNWKAHGRTDNRWETASWDASVAAWALIGSRQTVPGEAEREVFTEIDERPIERRDPC